MLLNLQSDIKIKLPWTKKQLEKILAVAAKQAKASATFQLSLLVVGDRKIRQLNKTFRKKDKVTDVLSFSPTEGEKLQLPQEEKNYLGEIFICYPQVKRQAKTYQQTIKAEFGLLFIHGFLHLLGYNHEKEKDYLKMKALEDKTMAKIV